MQPLKTHLAIVVQYFSGQEDDNVGKPYFVASNDELHFVTEGETFEELLVNIEECLALCLEDTDSASVYHVDPHAKVQLVMDMPYAQKTA